MTFAKRKKKQLCKNKSPRFSLKPPVGICSLKRKNVFYYAGPQLAKQRAPRSVWYVSLHSLRDSVWLSLFMCYSRASTAVFISWYHSNTLSCYLLNLEIPETPGVWTLKESSSTRRHCRSKSCHLCSVSLQVQVIWRWEGGHVCLTRLLPKPQRVIHEDILHM